MKTNLSAVLRGILSDTARETELARSKKSLKRLKQMIKDASPVLPFADALRRGNCLIAEIKEKSPSQGTMLPKNVADAPLTYKYSRVVKAVSVLTNRTHFGRGMTMDRLQKIKDLCGKPVLRKDFITESYQVYQARAYGADAVLLMANILDRNALCDLSDIAFELGMDVLFETHSIDELSEIPESAGVVGINCRDFNSRRRFAFARWVRQWFWSSSDKSTNTAKLDYAKHIPEGIVKIAESGVTTRNCRHVFSLGFDAALVGTSLLMDERGVAAALHDFESALSERKSFSASPESVAASEVNA